MDEHRATLDAELFPVITALANDQALDSRYRDHGLIGNWKAPLQALQRC